MVVGDRSSTCLRHTFVRGVLSESASYACYLLNECSRASQGLSVHCCIGVPRIRLSVSRHASGFLRCVSSSLHFSSVGAFVDSSVSWRLMPAKLASNESTISCANLATGVAPLAVPRSPGLSSCVHADHVYPSQASFDGGVRSDGICMPATCLLYTSPSPRDQRGSRMPSSA